MRPVFTWPTTQRYVSSGFLDSRSYGQHNAIDIPAPTGSPVEALAAGVVIFAGEAGAAGQAVFIDHPGGWRSHYCHLSRIRWNVREYVSQGWLIGDVGSTGVSTGPHLHLNLFAPTKPASGPSAYVDWVGKWAVDPLDYLTEEAPMPDANVAPPKDYKPSNFPQPEFGPTFPSWSVDRHIAYIYRLIRRRELRHAALLAQLREIGESE